MGENIDDVSSSSEEDKISAPSRKRVRVDEQLLSEDCDEDSNNEMEMISNKGLFQKRIALQVFVSGVLADRDADQPMK